MNSEPGSSPLPSTSSFVPEAVVLGAALPEDEVVEEVSSNGGPGYSRNSQTQRVVSSSSTISSSLLSRALAEAFGASTGTEDSSWRRDRLVAMRAAESSSSETGVLAFVGGLACFAERVDRSRPEVEEVDEAEERIEVEVDGAAEEEVC
jgi:hypothetical protein